MDGPTNISQYPTWHIKNPKQPDTEPSDRHGLTICLFSRTNRVLVQNCFSLLTFLSGPSLSARCPRGPVGIAALLCRGQTAGGGSIPRWSASKPQVRWPAERQMAPSKKKDRALVRHRPNRRKKKSGKSRLERRETRLVVQNQHVVNNELEIEDKLVSPPCHLSLCLTPWLVGVHHTVGCLPMCCPLIHCMAAFIAKMSYAWRASRRDLRDPGRGDPRFRRCWVDCFAGHLRKILLFDLVFCVCFCARSRNSEASSATVWTYDIDRLRLLRVVTASARVPNSSRVSILTYKAIVAVRYPNLSCRTGITPILVTLCRIVQGGFRTVL